MYINLREFTFRLTNAIRERIMFVSRGITVLPIWFKSNSLDNFWLRIPRHISPRFGKHFDGSGFQTIRHTVNNDVMNIHFKILTSIGRPKTQSTKASYPPLKSHTKHIFLYNFSKLTQRTVTGEKYILYKMYSEVS